MSNVIDIMYKLPPIMDVAISCADSNRKIPNAKDIMYKIQMSWFWLQEAQRELHGNTTAMALIHNEPMTEEPPYTLPPLPTALAEMDFIEGRLQEVTKEIIDYVTNVPMPDEVQYKMRKGYDNLFEAMFNTKLVRTYYEQLNEYNKPN